MLIPREVFLLGEVPGFGIEVVRVEREKGGKPRVTVTDSYRLVTVTWEEPSMEYPRMGDWRTEAQEGFEVLVPAETWKRVGGSLTKRKGGKWTWWERYALLEEGPSPRLIVAVTGAVIELPSTEGGGGFPGVQGVYRRCEEAEKVVARLDEGRMKGLVGLVARVTGASDFTLMVPKGDPSVPVEIHAAKDGMRFYAALMGMTLSDAVMTRPGGAHET